ncbi:unnamed protein product [Sphagnum balticum]
MINATNDPKAVRNLVELEKLAEIRNVVEYRLSNGLKVLLVENHSAPVVTFLVVYKVGSRNEGGWLHWLDHFLEHMLFKGTKKHNNAKGNGIDDLLTQIGAYWNATTWFDRTSYFEVVPSEYLEMCVELEADRMRNLLLRQEDHDSEMSVVRNELERGENYPEDALEKEMYAVAFREHPYHHPHDRLALGRRRSTTAKFLLRPSPYHPSIQSSRRKRVSAAILLKEQAIYRAFGQAITFLMLLIRTITHLLQSDISWAVRMKDSSRLYQSLIDSGIASDAFARHHDLRDPGLFMVGAMLNEGVDLGKAEAILYEELAKLASTPVARKSYCVLRAPTLRAPFCRRPIQAASLSCSVRRSRKLTGNG